MQQHMTGATTAMAMGAFTASTRGPAPTRRVDERGVVVGPWTAAARRSNALLQAVRQTR